MNYALLIFTIIYGGTTATSVPMQSQSICEKNRALIMDKYPHKWGESPTIKEALCIQTGVPN